MRTSIIKYLTIFLMTCDHVGLFLLDGFSGEVLRFVAQAGFPMWGFLMVQGYTHTRDFKAYFEKVLLLALISQFVYWTIGLHGFNPVFGLGAGLLVMWLHDWISNYLTESKIDFLLTFVACLLFIGILYIIGVHPIFPLMCYAFYLSRNHLEMMLLVGSVMIVYAGFGAWFGAGAFVGMAILIYANKVEMPMVLPRWLFYSYYPAHLMVIWLISISF